ncbi:MAG: deoxyribonuclease IV [Acidobacteria bacterium]|nr:deoxyribonuclease IV [Acidobacteriota bacterium]
MSVAGGVTRAVERAVLHGCESLQIFTKNASQWRAKPIDPAEARQFRDAVAANGLRPVVSHASYLINLATADPALRAQSRAALLDELDRADALGLAGVVLHPGTCTSGTEDDALTLVADAIRGVFADRPNLQIQLLLEHTAGQGRTIGYTFDHLATVIERLDGHAAVGICLDTCHLLASGYDIASEAGFASTFTEFERRIGFARLKVIHANDSKKPRGSRIDRHEHIGDGCVGDAAFARIATDPRFDGLPMILETAKSTDAGRPNVVVLDPLDARNLETLRRLRGA